MINPKANALLVKTEQALRAKVAPEQQANMNKIVAAGITILDSDQMHPLVVSQLKSGGDPAQIAGAGAAKLLGVLMNRSKGMMPMKAGIPAATILLLEVLDRLEALGKIEITSDTVSTAMQDFSASLMQLFGVDEHKLNQLTSPKPPAQAAQPQSPQPAQPLIGAPA